MDTIKMKIIFFLFIIGIEIITSEKEDVFVSKREFNEVLERLKTTEDVLKQLIGQKLDQREENQDNVIQILTTQNKNQQQQIEELQSQLASQRRKTIVIEKMVRQWLQSNVNPANEENKKESGQTTIGSEVENSGAAQNRIRRAANEVPVAFTATVSDHHITHAGDHQIIVFDNVITNVGNAYNCHVGTYIAPINGIYVFSVTLFAYPSVSFHANVVVKNGQTLTWMYLDGVNVGGYDTSSQTLVLQLQKGDDVNIQHRDADRSIHGYNYTLFSGFLLQEDTFAPIVVGKLMSCLCYK